MPCCIRAERLLGCDSSVAGNEGDNSEVGRVTSRTYDLLMKLLLLTSKFTLFCFGLNPHWTPEWMFFPLLLKCLFDTPNQINTFVFKSIHAILNIKLPNISTRISLLSSVGHCRKFAGACDEEIISQVRKWGSYWSDYVKKAAWSSASYWYCTANSRRIWSWEAEDGHREIQKRNIFTMHQDLQKIFNFEQH